MRRERPFLVVVWLLLTFVLLSACGDPEVEDRGIPGPLLDGGSVLDAELGDQETLSDASFDPHRSDSMIAVELTVAPADWERIRLEGRSINQSSSGCRDDAFAYSFVPASARINGIPIPRLGLRKKGYLGSISINRPSLRLAFDKYDPGQSFQGYKDLTLNNSRTDPSLMHQCLAFGLYAAAGLPAPRCGFAAVRVNGADLGIYVDVEPIKKPFLRRHFSDDEGNLYEGNSGADFRPENVGRFEKKTNEKDPDRSDLDRVAAALEARGEAMLAQLTPVLDVEQFLRFWAVETLIGMWDGYTGDLNNFFVYHDPTSDQFKFLPWGTDDSFSKTHPFLASGARPAASYAVSRLAGRLYEYEPTRVRYHAVLRDLLTQVWREDELSAEIDRLAALLGSSASEREVAALRRFVMTRRMDIEAELDAPYAPWTLGERNLRQCRPETNAAVLGTFATTWDSLFTAQPNPQTTLLLHLDGQPQVLAGVRVGIGDSIAALGPLGGRSLRWSASTADGGIVLLQFSLAAVSLDEPGEVPFHGFETYGLVLAGRGLNIANVGYIGEGKLIFEQLGTTPGAPVVGRLEGNFVQTHASTGGAIP